MMTAGHCVAAGGLTWFHKSLHIGGRVNHNYGPMDWGTIHVDDIAAPRPSTQVDLNNGTTAKISGLGRAPVGSQVCKSGFTTKQTCGTITAYDVSSAYDDGTTLKGLAKAQLVSDAGDSGGPVYQLDPSKEGFVIGQGMISGGPDTSVTYYQPIDSAVIDSDTIFVKSME